VPFDEWETLYRQRLQVERDLLAAAMGDAPGPPGAPGASGTSGTPGTPAGRGGGNGALEGEPSREAQLVGLAWMALLAVYGVSLVLDRILPGRRS